MHCNEVNVLNMRKKLTAITFNNYLFLYFTTGALFHFSVRYFDFLNFIILKIDF